MSDPKSTAAESSSATGKARNFKPRTGIVRKSKAERDAHAKEEAEKAAARAAAAAQATRKPVQGVKPGGSRKRESARETRDQSQGIPGGVFGAGTGPKPSLRKKIVDEGASEILDGQEAVTPSTRPKLLAGKDDDVKSKKGHVLAINPSDKVGDKSTSVEDEAYMGGEDDIDESRRDINRIEISSSEDEEDKDKDKDMLDSGKGKNRAPSESKKIRQGGGLRPVRAPRNSAEDRDGEAEERWDKTAGSNKVSHGEESDEHDEEAMEVDDTTELHQVKPDHRSSPEVSRRTKTSRRLGSRTKDSKLATETFEERAERIRLHEDIRKLKQQFTALPKQHNVGDAKEQDAEAGQAVKLFLFQFPPLVPFLSDQPYDPTQSSSAKQEASGSGTRIKSDPDGVAAVAAHADPAHGDSEPVLLRPEMEGMLTASERARLPPGLVGKLRIHKSGKVSLDWGGTDMEVRYGTEVDFLQDAVLVETPEAAGEDGEKNVPTTGTAYALGQIEKKMVVIPDWQKLYD